MADMGHHSARELIFIDETGIDRRRLGRDTGYALRGQRAETRRTVQNSQRISVISAIGYDGYLCTRVLPPGQTVTSGVFNQFLRQDVVPLLNLYNGRNPNSVVVLGMFKTQFSRNKSSHLLPYIEQELSTVKIS